MRLTFHSDEGHGWLAVPAALLREWGIRKAISPGSYRSRDRKTAYLEEDCDMAVFLREAACRGVTVETTEERECPESFVRGLPSFVGHRRKP